MDMTKKQASDTHLFKLATEDIKHLFRHSGVTGNSLSPFQYNAEQAATSNPSQGFRVLSEHPSFAKISRQLLAPDVKLLCHSGGSIAVEEQYHMLLSVEDAAVVAQFTNSQNELVILYFKDMETYLQWWVGIYGTEGSDDYAQLFLEQEDIEVLVCALHCIDIYRRAYMESMLDYRTGLDLSINTTDYVQLLKKALGSADLRWIIASLFELTPGLKQANISLKPEHISRVCQQGLLKNSDDSMLTLDKTAVALGTEFLLTWMGAVGWRASHLVNGEEHTLAQGLLSATSFANHMFSFYTEDGSSYRFSHQAGSRAALLKSLHKLLEDLRQKASGAVLAKRARFCGQCGSEIRTNNKFCVDCGATV